MRKLISGAISSLRRRFRDTFNRADAASLGTASDGSLWNIVRGAFSISANKAVGGSTDYPIAAVTMPNQNVAISLSDIGAGGGAALWVTDAGNWWAVGVYRQSEDCNCTEFYNSYTYSYNYTYVYAYNYTYSYSYISGYTPGNCTTWASGPTCCESFYMCNSYNTSNCCGNTCNAYNTSNCCGYTCYGYNAYNSKNKTGGNCQGNYCSCYNGVNCAASSCSCYNAVNCASSYNACQYYQGCNACIESNATNTNYANANANATMDAYATGTGNATGYSGPFYNCGTCYPSYLRVFRSVSNVVTTVVNQLIGETAPQSMKVLTSGTQITTKLYSDPSLVTQIGSDIVYTATGAAISPAYGITVVPSSYSQSYSVGEISIEKN
jgi:hypothetical protein